MNKQTKRITLEFEGFWAEGSKEKIPAASGIFIVFEGIYHEDSKTSRFEKVIYVGESDDVNAAVQDATKLEEWQLECADGCELFYSFAPISGEERERGAASIIFEQKPPANAEYKHDYPFENTEIRIFGKHGLLNTTYEVYDLDGEETPEGDDSEDFDDFGDLQPPGGAQEQLPPGSDGNPGPGPTGKL